MISIIDILLEERTNALPTRKTSTVFIPKQQSMYIEEIQEVIQQVLSEFPNINVAESEDEFFLECDSDAEFDKLVNFLNNNTFVTYKTF